MYKFLHTADVHLDSPLLNLQRYDGAPVEAFRSATRRAFDNLVELAISEQVAFVLIAGDLYDGDCKDFNTPIHFRRRMEDLRSNGIRVFMIQGNHDAENKMKKAFQLEQPENFCLFPTDCPRTIRLDEPGVAIHGQGFAQRDVIDDLSANYPEAVRGVLNIGLLHTSCGVYEGHDRYAPSSIAGLTTKEYDYWALGHIHKRENLAGPSPWIVYPGNPQGRHIREDGARGCVIVTIEHDRISKIDWHAIDVLRWQTCRVDAAACDEPDAILNDVELETEGMLSDSQGRPLAVRIEITGSTLAHSDLVRHATHWDRRIRETMLSRFDESVWVEKIKFRTQPANSRPVWERGDDPLGQLLESIADIDSVHSALAEIRDEYEQLLKYLPTDPRLTDLAPRIDEEHWERIGQEIVPEIKELLLARLLESSESV